MSRRDVTIWGYQKCVQNLIKEREGERPLGRRRHRQKDKVKMHLREIWVGNCGLNLTHCNVCRPHLKNRISLQLSS